jgi:hypothetical protein
MLAYALKSLFFLAVFPVALLRAGLNRWGFSLLGSESRPKMIFNILCGVGAWAAAAHFLNTRIPIGGGPWRSASDDDFMTQALSANGFAQPFADYANFWPWFVHQAQLETRGLYMTFWRSIEPHVLMIFEEVFVIAGHSINGIMIAGAILAAPLLIWIISTEIPMMQYRIKLRRYYRQHKPWKREFDRIRASIPEGTDDLDRLALLDQNPHPRPEFPKFPPYGTSGFVTGGPSGFFDRPNLRRKLRRLWSKLSWLRNFELFQYALGDAFLWVMGIAVPVISAVYLVTFLIPLVLTIGAWLLVILMLLIGFIPFAFLLQNGVRVRMH